MRIEFETGKLPRLLVIDDDEGITDFIKNVTEEMNFSVNCVHDYESIGNTYNEFNPDIIFLDLCLPGYDGVEVLHFLADMGCKSKIFLISGIDKITLNSAGDVGKQSNLNIAGVLSKPFLIEDIQQALGEELESLSKFTTVQYQNLFGSGEFEISYVPRMAIKTLAGSAITAVEAKVDWIGTQCQPKPLRELKSQIHSTDMLKNLCHSIFDKALETYKGWLDRGMDVEIVINLENEMALDPTLPSYLVNVTNKWEISPSRITIAISDSAALSRDPIMLDILTRLRIKGFKLSVETSGTNSSELDKLVHLPFSELKLKSRIIEGLGDDIEAEFNVSTLIFLADKLGLSTCADGVNSESCFNFLYECGCTVGQGEYFSKPLKHSEVEKFATGEQQHKEEEADRLHLVKTAH